MEIYVYFLKFDPNAREERPQQVAAEPTVETERTVQETGVMEE